MLDIDNGPWYCTCQPWQIVSQNSLQFTSDNESDKQMPQVYGTHTFTHPLFIKLSSLYSIPLEIPVLNFKINARVFLNLD